MLEVVRLEVDRLYGVAVKTPLPEEDIDRLRALAEVVDRLELTDEGVKAPISREEVKAALASRKAE